MKNYQKTFLLTIFIIAQSTDISDNELPQQALRSGVGPSKKNCSYHFLGKAIKKYNHPFFKAKYYGQFWKLQITLLSILRVTI